MLVKKDRYEEKEKKWKRDREKGREIFEIVEKRKGGRDDFQRVIEKNRHLYTRKL